MKIKDLKEMIVDLDDEMKIVVEGGDHSYLLASGGVVDAEIVYSKRGGIIHMGEHYGDDDLLEENSIVEKVFEFNAG